jgi:hypothetical protein
MDPTEDRPFVLRVLDLGYRERASSAHATLDEAMTAGDEARRKAPKLQRRYAIVTLAGERWELTGGQDMVHWRKE